jgi:SAM-dependent methyltransferase
MKHMWDERYSAAQFVYGKEPNDFFSAELSKGKPGQILLPGEGEGRNAVHAARSEWIVDAFDQSKVGEEKAHAFAAEQKVQINYTVSSLEDFFFKPDHYDVVGLVYFHCVRAEREYLHRKVIESLKPGGRVILEAFHKDQLGKNTGGPQSLALLFDEDMLLSDFRSLNTSLLEKQIVSLDEGAFHKGEASVIRFTGVKPA